jgi:hypothetical protein
VRHEDAFPPTTLSNRSRLGKPTFAGTRGNERDAPLPIILDMVNKPAGLGTVAMWRRDLRSWQ